MKARSRLQGFVDDPNMRTNKQTPNLGDLIQYLLIIEDISWEDLAPTFIPEALRRHVARCLSRQQSLQVTEDALENGFDSRTCTSVEELISAFDRCAPQAGMVSSFCIMFYKHVGRPRGRTLAQVEA